MIDTWVIVNEHNAVIRVEGHAVGSSPETVPPDRAVLLNTDTEQKLRGRYDRYLIQGTEEPLTLVAKPVVRFVLSEDSFPADGVSTAAIYLVPDETISWPVTAECNGQPIAFIDVETGFEIGPTTIPGEWRFHLTDDRYWMESNLAVVIAE